MAWPVKTKRRGVKREELQTLRRPFDTFIEAETWVKGCVEDGWTLVGIYEDRGDFLAVVNRCVPGRAGASRSKPPKMSVFDTIEDAKAWTERMSVEGLEKSDIRWNGTGYLAVCEAK